MRSNPLQEAILGLWLTSKNGSNIKDLSTLMDN